jgi:hypothetical protein
MSFQDALQEIMTIGEEKLNEGDYITVSNHLKTIYKSVNKPQKQRIVPVHIIRNYDRKISEDDQLDKNISFALTEEEQILVMKDRFRRYYETELEELNESIKTTSQLLKETREVKQDLYAEYKYSGCEEERSAHKSACMRERDIAKNLHELKTKLILVKQDMAARLNYR